MIKTILILYLTTSCVNIVSQSSNQVKNSSFSRLICLVLFEFYLKIKTKIFDKMNKLNTMLENELKAHTDRLD
jgi:hypothetical protein